MYVSNSFIYSMLQRLRVVYIKYFIISKKITAVQKKLEINKIKWQWY